MDSLGFLFKDLDMVSECAKWHGRAGDEGLASSLKLVGEYMLVGEFAKKDHKKAY